jgi:hypothetical protein
MANRSFEGISTSYPFRKRGIRKGSERSGPFVFLRVFWTEKNKRWYRGGTKPRFEMNFNNYNVCRMVPRAGIEPARP